VWEIEIEFTTFYQEIPWLSMTILLGLALPIFADSPGYSLGAVLNRKFWHRLVGLCPVCELRSRLDADGVI
jgi:hypothetical protein